MHANEDEAFYVVAGVMTYRIGDQLVEAGPETVVWLPRGVPHTFANRGDEEAWAVAVITPAGIEAMFEEQAAALARSDGPPDRGSLIELRARFGVTDLGPPLDALASAPPVLSPERAGFLIRR